MNDPLDLHGKPHSNLYYLTCPWLKRKLSRLEDSGYISRLQQQVASDENLLENQRQCQLRHAAEYQSSLNKSGSDLPKRQMLIAGASDPVLIKCLHSHVAFFLVHPEYLAGQEIATAVGDLWCPDDRCSAWMNEIDGYERDSVRQETK